MGAIGACGLVKAYGPRRALDGVDLEVPAGGFVSVMGPSGSGKSTLLHLLGALDTPTAGEVFFDGQPLSALDDTARTLLRRRRIGFVFQAYNLVPVLTVEENVALPAVIDGRSPTSYQERVDEVLELVGLVERRHQLPSELSGGEQQRTALARALLLEPDLLLADEPTGNLDSRTGLELLDALQQARRQNPRTVVVVTHDAVVASLADEVVLLRDGRIAGRLELEQTTEGGGRAHAVLAWLQELGA